MAAAKPSVVPTWATTLAHRVAPPAGKSAAGFLAQERPPASFFNHLLGLAGDWLAYLRDFEIQGHVWAPSLTGTSTKWGLVSTLDGADVNGRKTRTYVNDYGETVIAWGCYWDGSVDKWKPDLAGGTFYRLRFAENQIAIESKASASSWDDTDWVSVINAADLSNIAPAARGVISLGATPTKHNCTNIGTPSYYGGGDILTIPWGSAFADEFYQVVPMIFGLGYGAHTHIVNQHADHLDVAAIKLSDMSDVSLSGATGAQVSVIAFK